MKTHPFPHTQKRLAPRGILPSLAFLCHLTSIAQVQSGEVYSLKESNFTAGKGIATNDLYRLSGTFGATPVTQLHNDTFDYSLLGGWVSLTPVTTNRGGGCVDPPANLVNWWPFDELNGTAAHDIAGYVNNIGNMAAANSSPPSHIPGKVQNAIHFNGENQWMEVSDGTSGGEIDFDGNCFPGTAADSFTIDAWIYPEQSTGLAMLLDKRDGGNLRGYSLGLNNGFLRVELNTPNTKAYQGSHAISAHQWHFIAISYERCANVLKMYVDGSLTPVDTFTTPALGVLSNGAKLLVGRQHGAFTPPAFYKGALDELEIFKRALTDQEIHSIWLADSNGKCPDCAPNAILNYGTSGGNLVLSWSVPGYQLQSTTLLQGSATVWSPLPGASPVTVPTSPGLKFYRLICTH